MNNWLLNNKGRIIKTILILFLFYLIGRALFDFAIYGNEWALSFLGLICGLLISFLIGYDIGKNKGYKEAKENKDKDDNFEIYP